MTFRIVHVIETSGPGGGESVFIDLVAASRDAGHDVVAVVPSEGWVTASLRARGIEPVLLPGAARTRRPLDVAQLAALRRIIRAHRAQLVHSHMLGMSVYAGIAAASTGTPMLCTLHGQVDLAQGDRLRAIKLRIVGWTARHIVVVSDAMRRSALASTPWGERQVLVVHNGADDRALAAAPQENLRGELGLGAEHFLFAALGNIRVPKAYDDLLRAVAIVRQQAPRLRVAVIGQGEGALLQSLLALRSELGLDGIVHFVGFRENVGGLLAPVDAFVLSSRTEGFSIATVQAMALGRAVVATRSGGPQEILTDGVDGLLVPPADPPALAAAMLRLAADADLRARLGHAAHETVAARFSLERMCRRYLELYDHVAARRTAPQT